MLYKDIETKFKEGYKQAIKQEQGKILIMTSELKLFNYGDNAVRTIEQDGEVWFVAKDVCDILGIVNARDAIKSLDDDEKMTVANSDVDILPMPKGRGF